jgi:probable phosphoglycerate mutase
MPTRVLLIRHGQSEWNAAGRWQGQADPPLTDFGRQQARAASRAIGAVDAVIASDLQRATETAMIIAGELGVGPVVVDPGLRERDAGEWSGLTRAEIDRDWPGYLDPPADEHASFGPSAAPRRPPSWEPDDSVLSRALGVLSRIVDAVGDGDVLAVTHGGLIYVLEGHLGDRAGRMANLGGRWLTIDGPKMVLGDRVVLLDPDAVTIPDQI